MTLSYLPKNAFPLPSPLAPKLVALGLDDQIAGTVSRVFLSAALALKREWETEYTNACHAVVSTSDNRGYSSSELRAKLLTILVERYNQALSTMMEDAMQKTRTSLLKKKAKPTIQHKPKNTVTPPAKLVHPKADVGTRPRKEAAKVESYPFGASRPPHAFPHAYPPPALPEPTPFVTHIPLPKRSSKYQPKPVSQGDLDRCIDQFSRLSLGSPSPRTTRESSRTVPKSRSHQRTTSIPKPTSQLSPSRPRPVSPKLDTSVAVSHKSLPKITLPHPSPTTAPRTRSIDIPRSNRRKASSIPYQRPTTRPSVSPESSESYSPRIIRRTPSLVSDHGSEASSPSTPPDFSSIPIPTPTLPLKDSFPPTLLLEDFLIPWSEPGWEDIDFGTNFYG